MSARPVSSVSTLDLSASPEAAPLLFQVSGLSPSPFTRSKVSVLPSQVSSALVRVEGTELERVATPEVVHALLEVIGERALDRDHRGFDASRA